MKQGSGNSSLWVVAALLLFVVFSAVRTGVADVFSVQARDELLAISGDASAAVLADVARTLDAGLRLAPDNPDHYEDQARLALRRAAMEGASDADKHSAFREGLSPIREAIALRPASAYSWALLLRLKSGLGEYDTEFRCALERTTTLGPWEPGPQAVAVAVGLDAWDALPGTEREMVRAAYRRGLKRQAGDMLDIVLAHRNGCVVASGYDGCVQ